MPTYSYKCNNCNHQFDQRQRMSDDPLTECPECNGRIRRVVSSVGIVFKGSGFYITDNRNGKSEKSANSKNEKSTDSNSTSESKSDNKTKSDTSKSSSQKKEPAKSK